MTRRGRPVHRLITELANGTPPAFYDRAACRRADPKLFFPDHRPPTPTVLAICAACPVRVECLDYALSFGITNQFGVWGGMSGNAREALLRRRGASR